ncbi:metallophosphoesterase [Methylobacterium phyllosphaerae]
MRIWIFSDLHRRAYARPWTPAAIPDADVAVVAGDVGEGLAETVAWLAAAIRPAMPVVLVPGNHEYYGGTMQSDLAHGRRAAARQGIDLLDNDTVALAGCTLSGCSLWTDYALDGIAGRAAAMDAARAGLNDHRRIAWSRDPRWKPFRPEEALALHVASRRFLERALLERDPPDRRRGPHVVVTHHAPSPGSVAPAYAGHPSTRPSPRTSTRSSPRGGPTCGCTATCTPRSTTASARPASCATRSATRGRTPASTPGSWSSSEPGPPAPSRRLPPTRTTGDHP